MKRADWPDIAASVLLLTILRPFATDYEKASSWRCLKTIWRK